MQPQDQFARGFAEVSARLTARADGLRDVADVDVESAPTFWRLVLAPRTAGACPVEIVVDPSAQTFDLQIGPDVHEGLSLGRVLELDHMVAAIVDGRASRRTGCSAAGGVELWAETVLDFGTGELWRRRRMSLAGERLNSVAVVERARMWLPYRR